MTQAVSIASSTTTSFPRAQGIDNTLALLHEGYAFISNRCNELGVDAFETTLRGRRVICMRGEEAARLFYGGGNFTRVGTTPPTVIHMLREKGSVEQLEGESHRWRKAMFMSLMSEPSIASLLALLEDEWRRTPPSRSSGQELESAVRPILSHAAARWIGVPPSQEMDDALVPMETGTIKGIRLRHRARLWAEHLIEEVRACAIEVTPGRPLAVISEHRDEKGSLLVPKIAAAELLNVVRPIVAVARFIAYAADARAKHPVDPNDEDALERFVQEVRRLYPFFPAVAGRALQPLTFRRGRIEKGALVLFDLYGTNHDADIWPDPNRFHPERFKTDPPTGFDLVPQGGGDYLRDHRCPGEPLAIAIVKRAVQLLSAHELRPRDPEGRS